MSNTNDQLQLGSVGAVTISGKLFNDSEQRDAIKETMSKITPYYDDLLKTTLILRGKKYSLDGIHYSEEDVHEQLIQLCKKHNVEELIEIVKKDGEDFYKTFAYSEYVDKNGKLKTSVNGQSKDFANSLFSISDPKQGSRFVAKCPAIAQLRKYGFFPIKVNNLPLDGNLALKYSITKDVQSKLTSFEEINKEYEGKKQNWQKTMMKMSGKLTKLETYGNLLNDIRSIEEMSKFKQDNYRKFLNRWRGDHREGKKPRQGMREYFLDLLKNNPNYIFIEKDKYLFGYGPEFMNLLFKNYRELWEEEDIIGRQLKTEEFKGRDYVDIVHDSFHWAKESVGISTCGRYGKFAKIHLGNNFIKFDLVKNGNQFYVSIDSLNGENKKQKLVICNSPQFDDTTSINLINRAKKNGELADTQTTQLRYSADSKKQTWYTGLISEPILEYSCDKDAFYIRFPLTEHAVEGAQSGYFADQKELNEARNYFMSAPPSNDKQKEKRTLKDGSFNIMGVDLNLCIPFYSSVYEVIVKDGQLSSQFIKSIHNYISENCEEREKQIISLHNRVIAAKSLIWQTKDYVHKKEASIKPVIKYKEYVIDINRELGINTEEYAKSIAKYREYTDESVALNEIKRDSNWILPSIIRTIKTEISMLRNEYLSLETKEERANYCRNRNHIDVSILRKKSLVKSHIELLRSYSTFGLNKEEIQKIRANKNGGMFASDLLKWYKGLIRKCSQMASSIIKVARDNNVKFIFLEDLDCQTSLFSSKDDNNLKIILGWGDIKKWLCHHARKHNIALVAVDPYLTSQIHHETGLLGAQKGRDLFVFLPNGTVVKINRDENASHNRDKNRQNSRWQVRGRADNS